MELQALKVTTRKRGGKGDASKTRATGKLPAVLYGGDGAPVSLAVDVRSFETLIHHSRGGEHALVRLDIEDQPDLSTPALVKAVQRHPVRENILHADFLRIRLDQRIATVVPVRLVGQAPGIADGGVMDHQMRVIEVECLALEVPDEFVVDISNLHINESIHVSQVAIPDNITVLSDPARPVVAVHPPRVIKEAVPAEGAVEGAEGEAASPEVITERKEEEKDKEKEKEKEKKK